MLTNREFHLQTGNLAYKTGFSFTKRESWVTKGILGLLFTDFSEDTNENEEYYIQVDIWSKEDCFKLKKKVKKLLKKAGFTYFTGNDQYEVETGIYHKAARFYFSMNVEGEK